MSAATAISDRRLRPPRFLQRLRPRGTAATVLIELSLMCVVGLPLGYALTTHWFPIALGFVIAALMCALVFADQRRVIVAIIVFTLLLGTIRRVLEAWINDPNGATPLLAVPSIVTFVLILVAIRQGAFRNRTPLANAVLMLCGLAVLGAVNPLQGSLLAGGLGLVLFLTPVAWFWIGRSLITDAVMRGVYLGVLAMGALAGFYGIFQSLGHFFQFDLDWANNINGYTSIRVKGVIRAFGLSSSAAEYGKVLGCAVAIAVALIVAKRSSRVILLLISAMLGMALVLSALRTTLLLTVVAAGLVVGARNRVSYARLALYGVLAIVLLYAAVSVVAPSPGASGHSDPSTSGAGTLVSRQVSGLANPLSSSDSTLTDHIKLVESALKGIPGNPVGIGTASITIAGKRFGTSQAGDMDMADAAIAWGLFGAIVYVLLTIRIVRQGMLVARSRRDWLALAALAVAAVSGLQWLNAGLYSASMIAWLTFGWLDRPDHLEDMSRTGRARAEVEAATAAAATAPRA